MCIIAGKIDSISKTSIFARSYVDSKGHDRQFLVYSMDLDAPADVAMILPIPVQHAANIDPHPQDMDDPHADDISFISLADYDDFFNKVDGLFPQMRSRGMDALSMENSKCARPKLEVHTVGSFDASYCPRMSDMDRLDERFQIDKAVWEKLPQYATWGFAVFKLSKGAGKRHPMAFNFRTFEDKRVYFPTVHVHNGHVPAEEDFDHALYTQGTRDHKFFDKSAAPGDDMRDASKKIITSGVPVLRFKMQGEYPNDDIYATI